MALVLAKCIRRCWDSQATKRYFEGDVDKLPEDHVFLTGKTKCFEPITEEDLRKGEVDLQTQIRKLAEMVAAQTKVIEDLTKKPTPELQPEPEVVESSKKESLVTMGEAKPRGRPKGS